MKLPKLSNPNVWIPLVITVIIFGYYLFFKGVQEAGNAFRANQDKADRIGCLGKYETPECLVPRLKKAELRRQYEESIKAIDNQTN